jgi:cyanophycin synthetase
MTEKDIKILRLAYLRGPNIWTYRPVVEALVDIGALEDCPSNTLPGFTERLCAWLPGLAEHRCGVGEPGGFLLRLREGTWPAHIMEHVAIELQNLAGSQVGFGKARETEQRGIYKLAVRARQEDVGFAAVRAARELVLAAIDDQAFDVKATVKALTAMVDRLCLGPSTAAIADAAAGRGIPSIRLTDGNLVQLGYGSRQRRIWTAETDRTSAIAESVSRDKDLTKSLLKACGVPIPEGEIVHSPSEAWGAAQDIGLPVVVKPTDGNHGRGVSLDLRTQAEVEAAYPIAEVEGSDVMVERHIHGEEHRLLVVGGKLVAASRGEVASITGDGSHTVAQLIELQINSDPRRGEEEGFLLDTIRLNEHTTAVLELQRQGLTADSVPEAGRHVVVMRTGNMGHDVTDAVHPDVAEMAALAARVVGLDIAGIDLVARDISQPLDAQGGAIVEVNAGPSLLMHLKPAVGTPRPCGEAVVNHLFAASDSGRIPVVGVTGGPERSVVARLLARVLQLSGPLTGLACAAGLYIGHQKVVSGKPTEWEAGQRCLINRNIEAAVIENSPRSILKEGLAYDRCQVGIVTGVPGPEGMDDPYIHDMERMRLVLRTQVDVVLKGGCAVLNADDEVARGLAELCDGEVILYGTNSDAPAMQQHCANGGRFVTLRGQQVLMCHQQTQTPLLDLAQPAIAQLLQRGALSTSALLAVAAAAWALNLSPGLVRAAVESSASVLTES